MDIPRHHAEFRGLCALEAAAQSWLRLAAVYQLMGARWKSRFENFGVAWASEWRVSRKILRSLWWRWILWSRRPFTLKIPTRVTHKRLGHEPRLLTLSLAITSLASPRVLSGSTLYEVCRTREWKY